MRCNDPRKASRIPLPEYSSNLIAHASPKVTPVNGLVGLPVGMFMAALQEL